LQNYKSLQKWFLMIGLFAVLVIYKCYNPYEVSYFPKCPFRLLTGLQCPGCGSQRALHYILNLEISKAFKENALLVCSIPYLIIGFSINSISKPALYIQKWRKRLFGMYAIYIVLFIIISFWILRNIF